MSLLETPEPLLDLALRGRRQFQPNLEAAPYGTVEQLRMIACRNRHDVAGKRVDLEQQRTHNPLDLAGLVQIAAFLSNRNRTHRRTGGSGGNWRARRLGRSAARSRRGSCRSRTHTGQRATGRSRRTPTPPPTWSCRFPEDRRARRGCAAPGCTNEADRRGGARPPTHATVPRPRQTESGPRGSAPALSPPPEGRPPNDSEAAPTARVGRYRIEAEPAADRPGWCDFFARSSGGDRFNGLAHLEVVTQAARLNQCQDQVGTRHDLLSGSVCACGAVPQLVTGKPAGRLRAVGGST